MTTEPLAVSMAEAARLLSISRAQAYRLAQRGDLPTVRVGQRLRVARHALEKLIGEPTP